MGSVQAVTNYQGQVISYYDFMPLGEEVARTPPLITRDKLLEIRQPCWVVSADRAKRLTGFEPLMPAETALAETAAWYKSAGWL